MGFIDNQLMNIRKSQYEKLLVMLSHIEIIVLLLEAAKFKLSKLGSLFLHAKLIRENHGFSKEEMDDLSQKGSYLE